MSSASGRKRSAPETDTDIDELYLKAEKARNSRLKVSTADKMVFVAQNKNASVVEACDEEVLVADMEALAHEDAQREVESIE